MLRSGVRDHRRPYDALHQTYRHVSARCLDLTCSAFIVLLFKALEDVKCGICLQRVAGMRGDIKRGASVVLAWGRRKRLFPVGLNFLQACGFVFVLQTPNDVALRCLNLERCARRVEAT